MAGKVKYLANLLSPVEVSITGPEELLEWCEEQTLFVPGYKFTPRFKHKKWDGKYTPGKWCRAHSPGVWELRGSRGLIGRLGQTHSVERSTRDKEHWERLRSAVEHWALYHPKLAMFDTPERKYQEEAILRGLLTQWGRVALATNAGKGACIALCAE
ncbi:hypothetical protein LCGC14_2569870, partial [marine sediment metagenome]